MKQSKKQYAIIALTTLLTVSISVTCFISNRMQAQAATPDKKPNKPVMIIIDDDEPEIFIDDITGKLYAGAARFDYDLSKKIKARIEQSKSKPAMVSIDEKQEKADKEINITIPDEKDVAMKTIEIKAPEPAETKESVPDENIQPEEKPVQEAAEQTEIDTKQEQTTESTSETQQENPEPPVEQTISENTPVPEDTGSPKGKEQYDLFNKGHITGPSGKETYYDLDMANVIAEMRKKGYTEEAGWNYWIREDGVKMFGPYAMVAANLTVRPKGTIVVTSIGEGIVCDTGDFAISNPTMIDIATNWTH